MSSLVERQLAAIAEVREVSKRLGVDAWLRGGWAVDFCLGRVTRDHADIDWFVWAGHLPAFAEALRGSGWRGADQPDAGPHQTYALEDVQMCFQVLSPGGGIAAEVGHRPLPGQPWPAGMVADAQVGRIGGQPCLTISPAAQLRIKRMMPSWFPGRTTRPKDVEDIAFLERLSGRDERESVVEQAG